MKELKIPVSCRIHPDLKEDLELEAQEAGLTTSLYLEQILQSRHEQAELDENLEAEAEELRAKVKSQQNAAERIKGQLEEVRNEGNDYYKQLTEANEEKAKLQVTVKKLEGQTEPLKRLGLLDLSPSDVEELESYLADLGVKYPDLSRPYLILAALNRTVKNEKGMLIIHTIDNY